MREAAEAAATEFVNLQDSLRCGNVSVPASKRVRRRPGADGMVEFVPQI